MSSLKFNVEERDNRGILISISMTWAWAYGQGIVGMEKRGRAFQVEKMAEVWEGAWWIWREESASLGCRISVEGAVTHVCREMEQASSL